MDSEQTIIHRGKWKDQPFPNSFETFRLYGGAVEADIKLLNDGQTLAVVHPSDFQTTHEVIENMDPSKFDALKVRSGEEESGAAPLFSEYLLGCYDRGVKVSFEITASTVEMAKQAARQAVETVKRLQEDGAFKVNGQEYPEFIEQMAIHSYIPEVVIEAKKALKEIGVKLQLGFSWLTSPDFAKKNPLATTALDYYEEGENWEQAGLRAAKKLKCDFVFLIEPSKITSELVDSAHAFGLRLYVWIRPDENTETQRNRLLELGVDKLLY